MEQPQATLDAMVANGDAVGAVAIAIDDSGQVFHGAAGWRDREAQVPMTNDTIFYTASMTKAITSLAAMQCVERGQLTLDEPISDVLPMLENPPVLEGFEQHDKAILRPAKRPITLRHLLTHTSGLGYTTWNARLYEYRQRCPEATPIAGPDIRRSAPLVHEPGEVWEYGTSTDFVGLAVEAVSGQGLAAYFRDNIFTPLAMPDTFFDVPPAKAPRVAARYLRQSDTVLVREPETHQPAAVFHSGGGGLYSTASDYARFLGAFLGLEETMKGQESVLSAASVATMSANQIGTKSAGQMPSSEPHRSNDVAFFQDSSAGWGLGFLINAEPVASGRAAGSLAWAGLYNSYYWMDPTHRVAGALFTQVLPFADPRVLRALEEFERGVYKLRAA